MVHEVFQFGLCFVSEIIKLRTQLCLIILGNYLTIRVRYSYYLTPIEAVRAEIQLRRDQIRNMSGPFTAPDPA
jgi:hypothetical protein